MQRDNMNQPDYGHAFETLLRAECSWQAPPELTACLLNLASTATASPGAAMAHANTDTTAPPPPQPVTWYSILVIVLTSVAVGLSFAITWEVYGAVGAGLGLDSAWHQVQALVASGARWLTNELPALHAFVQLITTTYNQLSWLLNWLLVAMVLWLALDDYAPRSTGVQQQQPS